MSQLLRSDIFLKDQASVTAFRDVFSSRYDKIVASGGTLLQLYVDQDDPTHLVYMIQWESREHYAEYMKWASIQPDREKLGALLASPPGHVWLDKVDE